MIVVIHGNYNPEKSTDFRHCSVGLYPPARALAEVSEGGEVRRMPPGPADGRQAR
jgi:hypothetical protein